MPRPPIRSLCHELSDWEIVEAYVEHLTCNTYMEELATRYGIASKTLYRAFERLENKAREMRLV